MTCHTSFTPSRYLVGVHFICLPNLCLIGVLSNSLLKDWKTKPELVGAAAAIPVLEAFTLPLGKANTEFETLFVERSKNKGTDPKLTAEDAQAATIDAYETLTKTVGGFILTTEENAPWKALAAELQGHWDQYETTHALKQGRAAAAKEDDKPA